MREQFLDAFDGGHEGGFCRDVDDFGVLGGGVLGRDWWAEEGALFYFVVCGGLVGVNGGEKVEV